MIDNYFAVVMAGGGGTRFWPRSRMETPKQLLAITGEKTLIRETVDRLLRDCPPENVVVVTNAAQAERTVAELPDIPAENILAEPAKRNTAPCIGLAAAFAQHRSGGDPVLGVFSADHSITPPEAFSRAVRVAVDLATTKDGIVTVGIPPTFPSTGYGYIQQGAAVEGVDPPAHQVTRFTEKPDLPTAERFLADGGYVWNAGIFFFRAGVVMEELRRQQPEIRRRIDALRPALGTDGQDAAVADAYEDMPEISFDYAVMENAETVCVLEAPFEWDDVGSWRSLERHFPKDEDGNVLRGDAVLVDARDNTVDSKRLVALVGVEGLVVVETDDAILVCSRAHAQDVKTVVQRLEEEGRSEYL